nr:mRNA-capping enzyme [Onthophagus taurus]
MSGSRSGRQNRGPVPNRWLKCPRRATDLIVDKFLAFKTPLDHNFDNLVPLECRFPPQFIFDFAKLRKLKLGLWIDLTNTTRFYNSDEVKNQDCRYTKLQCRGFGETPSKEQTALFIKIVHKFIAQHPLHFVAVHCTHGFNRSGFLIVSYLVEEMDFDIQVALEMFSKVRPPGIYKQEYLDELYRRYGQKDDEVPQVTSMPDWCDEDEQDDYYRETPDFNAPTSSNSTPMNNQNHRRKNGRIPVFMEGIPGVKVFDEQPKALELQRKVQRMCNWGKKGFPGCQPVSMDMDNIHLLHKKPYRVSWKADGVRYMMLIDGEDEVYFFDRDHSIFKVTGVRFVYRKNLMQHLQNTLIDGEMVIDKVKDERIPRFLVYDIIMFDGKDIGVKSFFPERLQFIEYEVVNPRYWAIEKGLIKKDLEPFSVRKKEFWPITQAVSLLGEKFAKSLSHEPDGLIFQPSKEPYVTGQCDEVLKWKPLELNSVDFRLKLTRKGGEGLVTKTVGELYVGQFDRPFAHMKYTRTLQDLDNKIIECKFEDGVWKFMRERTDKSFPNSYNTAKSVCQSIKNPVTKDRLIDFINNHRFDDDCEKMPPPSKRVRRT